MPVSFNGMQHASWLLSWEYIAATVDLNRTRFKAIVITFLVPNGPKIIHSPKFLLVMASNL